MNESINQSIEFIFDYQISNVHHILLPTKKNSKNQKYQNRKNYCKLLAASFTKIH